MSQTVFLSFGISSLKYAGIAQLVEHDLAKVGVASSSLVSRSVKINQDARVVEW